MSSLAQLAARYQATVDEITRLREVYDFPAPVGSPELVELNAAKDRMCEAHAEHSRAWERAVAAAPRELILDAATGRITIGQMAAGNSTAQGGRFRWLMPADAGYAAVLAEIKNNRAIDARVAEAAYAAWGWRGAVRIDYYGVSAVVTDGTRRLTIQLADLTPAAPPDAASNGGAA